MHPHLPDEDGFFHHSFLSMWLFCRDSHTLPVDHGFLLMTWSVNANWKTTKDLCFLMRSMNIRASKHQVHKIRTLWHYICHINYDICHINDDEAQFHFFLSNITVIGMQCTCAGSISVSCAVMRVPCMWKLPKTRLAGQKSNTVHQSEISKAFASMINYFLLINMTTWSYLLTNYCRSLIACLDVAM